MKILVTGGCGYKGSVLIPLLLADGHNVISLDTKWFGDALPAHPNLVNLKLDVRETDAIPLDGVEAIIHLANIANDPAVELNPTLSWEVNVLAGQQLADRAVRAGVKHFLFASSGSVYGVKDELFGHRRSPPLFRSRSITKQKWWQNGCFFPMSMRCRFTAFGLPLCAVCPPECV